MNSLILDVGNTQSKLFVKNDGTAVEQDEFIRLGQWGTPKTPKAVEVFLREIQDAIAKQPPSKLIVASVVLEVSLSLAVSEPDAVFLDHTHCDGMKITIESPETVGMDRFCNVKGALDKGLKNAIIVDVGTATTFDILQDSVFIGGLIAPGPKLAHDCLGEKGARLMNVDFGPQPLQAGVNSVEALARGGWNVGMGGILWTIEGLIREYGPTYVLLTGGLGRLVDQPDWEYDPYLTLRGALHLGQK